MAGASVMLPGLERREHRLKDALAGLRIDDGGDRGYSYVFIDCPPSLGLLTINSLVASDQVIIPVQTEYYALEGLAQLMSTITAVRERLNPSLRICGLALTMVDTRTQNIRCRSSRRCSRAAVPGTYALGISPARNSSANLMESIRSVFTFASAITRALPGCAQVTSSTSSSSQSYITG